MSENELIEKLREAQEIAEFFGGVGFGIISLLFRGSPMGAWEIGSALGISMRQRRILKENGVDPNSEYGQYLLQEARKDTIWRMLRLPKFLIKKEEKEMEVY